MIKYILLVILANHPPHYAGTYDTQEGCMTARNAVAAMYKANPGASMCIPAKTPVKEQEAKPREQKDHNEPDNQRQDVRKAL